MSDRSLVHWRSAEQMYMYWGKFCSLHVQMFRKECDARSCMKCGRCSALYQVWQYNSTMNVYSSPLWAHRDQHLYRSHPVLSRSYVWSARLFFISEIDFFSSLLYITYMWYLLKYFMIFKCKMMHFEKRFVTTVKRILDSIRDPTRL